MLRRIQDFVAAGVVDYHYVAANAAELDRAGLHLQRLIYDTCLARHGRAHRFMGFLDADEFVILMEPKASLPDLLQEYEDFGGLAMNWQVAFFPYDTRQYVLFLGVYTFVPEILKSRITFYCDPKFCSQCSSLAPAGT